MEEMKAETDKQKLELEAMRAVAAKEEAAAQAAWMP